MSSFPRLNTERLKNFQQLVSLFSSIALKLVFCFKNCSRYWENLLKIVGWTPIIWDYWNNDLFKHWKVRTFFGANNFFNLLLEVCPYMKNQNTNWNKWFGFRNLQEQVRKYFCSFCSDMMHHLTSNRKLFYLLIGLHKLFVNSQIVLTWLQILVRPVGFDRL